MLSVDASKTPLEHTVLGFVIWQYIYLSNITRIHTYTHIPTTLWRPYQHTHTIIAAVFIKLAENRNKASICFIDQTWKNGTI